MKVEVEFLTVKLDNELIFAEPILDEYTEIKVKLNTQNKNV
jgi:hypothetical protein